jgi:hypothetical protein
MRADGFAPASEVAAALGVNLSTVHRQLDSGTMPGKTVGASAHKHRFVDVRALIASNAHAASPTATQALQRVASTLGPVRQAPGATARS